MKNNKKGFTLAELLIVVAIIGILVAISIPIFTSQLTKAKDATNLANARSMYAQLSADFMDDSVVNDAPEEGGSSFSSWSGDSDTVITVGQNQYKFTHVDGAGLEYNTGGDGRPIVSYTRASSVVGDGEDGTVTYGASGS